ncbi:MAG TPA: diaminopimelate epimerase [Candidatus Binataceae bacterium]|nr:diaminopimelate epimerase [Candidatus Binataceae bacterium]
MRKLPFVKMHGCGNDYIYVVADRLLPADPASLAQRLSDRRFGVGGDGLIMLCPSAIADVRMEMYNADGSRGEMCGNGIRCVARLYHEISGGRKNPVAVETDCGIKTIELSLADGRVIAATVDMGEPILEGRQIPADHDGRVVDHALEVDGRVWKVTALSMGNPHCVVFVDDDGIFRLDDGEFARLGRPFEHHPFFPRRVNTEFILPLARNRLRMRVWERGSGETLACGTGACAALVAAVLTGRADRRATVELRGGNLEIEWRDRGVGANHVFMTGEAVEVFRGEVEVGDRELVAAGGRS